MVIFEIGTGYTPIPAKLGAATEIVVEELAKALLTLGQKVTLVDIRDPGRRQTSLPAEEVPVPRWVSGTDVTLGILHKGKRVVYSIALARKLHRLIRQAQEPVLLHFHNQYNLFFFLTLTPPAMRRRVKLAYTVHSYIWSGEWEEIRKTVRRRYFQEMACVRRADYVLVLNDKSREHFVTRLGVPPEHIHIIQNGVNPEHYHPLSQPEQEAFRRENGLEGRPFAFQAGSVCSRKDQLGALMLLTPYLKRHPEALYLFAGGIPDPAYFETLLTYARSQGLGQQVRYVGEIPPGRTLNFYYSTANVTLFPSRQESFGLVILESIAAGTPVLLRKPPPFALEQGCLVCGEDVRFEAAIARLMRQKKTAQTAAAEISRHYCWNAAAEAHLRLFS